METASIGRGGGACTFHQGGSLSSRGRGVARACASPPSKEVKGGGLIKGQQATFIKGGRGCTFNERGNHCQVGGGGALIKGQQATFIKGGEGCT